MNKIDGGFMGYVLGWGLAYYTVGDLHTIRYSRCIYILYSSIYIKHET